MGKPSRWRLASDREAQEDAGRHDVPIPSRRWILAWFERLGRPAAEPEVVELMRLDDPRQHEGLRRRLRAMERDGQLIRNRAGDYGLVDRMDLVRGTVQAHRDGYGFLVPDEGGEDLFLSPRTMSSLLHDDRIVVRLSRSREAGRPEAKLVELIERRTTQVVGRYFRERAIGFVYPERRVMSQDLLIPPEHENGASDGQMVVARLIEQPSPRARPIGEIVEILGKHMAPGLEIDVAIRAHGLPDAWPEAVEQAVAGLGPEVPEADKADRRDLCELPLVTIDGADAKDFDDAVWCKPTPGGWRLVVAIADVSAYVTPGSALDEEAASRGNSTYFPGHVVPMLPEVLSNGLCSLNPHRDRLCMVCDMNIDRTGEVKRATFYEAVMHSHARLTYDEVADAVVERDPATRERLADVLPHLESLHQLYGALAEARERRGCLEFEGGETQIVFGPDRKIDRIRPVTRNDAHRMIEECMIAANVCAARFLSRRRVPGVFRVHDRPSGEKVADLRKFLKPLGLRLGGGKEVQTADFAKVARQARGRDDARMVSTAMLRSMPQARYTPDCDGHFGLALGHYTHFTSPIRRYPDLVVHRAIKQALLGKRGAWPPSGLDLAAVADRCSATERRSDEASRDVVSWLKCEFMLDKVGERFEGTVSGVAPFGVFVELDGAYVEGLVHVSGLGRDYFHYDPVHLTLSGERSGETYRIGRRVSITVARVDLDERKVDFELNNVPRAPDRDTRPGPRRNSGPGRKAGAGRNRGRRRGR